MVKDKKIYLAILNITSWGGQCADATHVYGHLILSEKEEVTIDNIEDWNVKYLGDKIEIRRPLTEEIAKKLDRISGDNGKSNQRHFRIASENPELMEEYGYTNRFDTFSEVVNAGIEKWKELDIDCPFISLYDGDKYVANSYEPSTSVILQYEKK